MRRSAAALLGLALIALAAAPPAAPAADCTVVIDKTYTCQPGGLSLSFSDLDGFPGFAGTATFAARTVAFECACARTLNGAARLDFICAGSTGSAALTGKANGKGSKIVGGQLAIHTSSATSSGAYTCAAEP